MSDAILPRLPRRTRASAPPPSAMDALISAARTGLASTVDRMAALRASRAHRPWPEWRAWVLELSQNNSLSLRIRGEDGQEHVTELPRESAERLRVALGQALRDTA